MNDDLGQLINDNPRGRRSRRHFLRSAGATVALPLLGAVAAEPVTSASSPAVRRKLRVVVAGGHPGDPEYGCGGTIARYTDLGHDVVLLYLNRGDPAETASRPASESRVEEARNACKILRARPVFAGQIDGHAIVDEAHHGEFRRLLEAEKPDAVFTHWPIDNHADHRAMSLLVYDAWQRLGRKFAFFYYEVSNGEDTVQFSPTHYVDISQTEARKRLACYAHASQSPDRFYALQETVTRMRGVESGHKQAEGFAHHIQSPEFALPRDG
jgi:LmbE family N-acetylglucosaminyl deacetylase